jgi:hypothetical protein
MCVYVVGEGEEKEDRRRREGWQAKAYLLPDYLSTHLEQ